MFDQTGRVALVTGAGQGVGRSIALQLASLGAAVAVNDLSAERAASTVDVIASNGGRAVSAVADVTSREAVSSSCASVAAALGAIDILVNNAGIPPTGFGVKPFVDSDPVEWDPYLAVGLRGVMLCSHAVLPSMVGRRWGRVITITSDAGRFGEPGMAAYVAAKAGAAGLMRGLAKEVGPAGVTCNSISLGSIDHGDGQRADVDRQASRYPMRRLGTAADVATAVTWLASDEAAWVTGQTISVNGGYMTT